MVIKDVAASAANSVKEYIGAYQTTSSEYESILTAVVSEHSLAIYDDTEKLKTAMRAFGASETQIAKVYMMTLVTGFREILEFDHRTQQVDIERYVQNAIKETGFNNFLVLELTAAIVASLGIDELVDYKSVLQKGNETAGFVVPASVYADELKSFDLKFKSEDHIKLDATEINRLEVLARAGIPKAKYFLGLYLVRSGDIEEKTPIGLQYLEAAAADGDSQAAGALGDFYYELATSDSWSEAYLYYTGHGSISLNESRRERIVDILNVRKFNKKVIITSILLALAMLATVFLAPGAPLFAAHRVCGFICFIIEAGVIIFSILHYRVKPYDDLSWMPGVIFIPWALYMLIRVIF